MERQAVEFFREELDALFELVWVFIRVPLDTIKSFIESFAYGMGEVYPSAKEYVEKNKERILRDGIFRNYEDLMEALDRAKIVLKIMYGKAVRFGYYKGEFKILLDEWSAALAQVGNDMYDAVKFYERLPSRESIDRLYKTTSRCLEIVNRIVRQINQIMPQGIKI